MRYQEIASISCRKLARTKKIAVYNRKPASF